MCVCGVCVVCGVLACFVGVCGTWAVCGVVCVWYVVYLCVLWVCVVGGVCVGVWCGGNSAGPADQRGGSREPLVLLRAA